MTRQITLWTSITALITICTFLQVGIPANARIAIQTAFDYILPLDGYIPIGHMLSAMTAIFAVWIVVLLIKAWKFIVGS